MDVKCPRCEDEFEIDELVYSDDVKCQKCGLFIEIEGDDLFRGPVARLYEVEPEDLLPEEE